MTESIEVGDLVRWSDEDWRVTGDWMDDEERVLIVVAVTDGRQEDLQAGGVTRITRLEAPDA